MTSNNGNRRLDSWKEIAVYLRRDERTAIRWEKQRGLPVHRVPGGKRNAVFAYTAEMEAWLSQKAKDSNEQKDALPGPSPRSEGSNGRVPGVPRYGWLVVGILIISALAVGLSGRMFSRSSESIPARLQFSVNAVQAFDQQNRFLWSHSYARSFETGAYERRGPYYEFPFLGDFRGDGGIEALVPVIFQTSAVEDAPLAEVDMLSERGDILWSYAPSPSFQFGKNIIGQRWSVSNLFVSHRNRKPQIWASFAHGTWGNTFIVNLDPVSGKDTLRFMNTGSLHTLSEFHNDRDYLIAGGFNNESDSASLAITDQERAFAASPQTPGSRHECVTCPAGRPDFYFIFPRAELVDLEGDHEDAVYKALVTGNQIEVQKSDANQRSLDLDMYYELRIDQGFRPVAFRFGSGYDMLHRKLEREGKLNHTLENCPERLHPKPIKMWTPSGGWTTVQLPPTPFSQ